MAEFIIFLWSEATDASLITYLQRGGLV